MSEEVQEQVAAVAEPEEAPAAPEPEPPTAPEQEAPAAAKPEAPVVEEPKAPVVEEPKKSVTFEQNELSFDEAQAEIDAIKSRAGRARESLKIAPSPISSTGSYSSSYSTSLASEDDSAKSKNMLSHLNTHSAMLNYKVQAARSLVRKQEDLLRNLARMRENMERSENEIGKASDYYSTRYQPRGYFERRAESAPLISRRQQVREPSPVISICGVELPKPVERAYSPPAPSPTISSHISVTPTPVILSSDYQPDEDFEREMAAIRKRVANLSKQATEVTTPKYNRYLYDSALTSSYMPGDYSNICSAVEPSRYEVKSTKSHKHVPRTYHKTSLPATTTIKHVAIGSDSTPSYPRNSYTDYLMDSVNELGDYSCNTSPAILDVYGDSLVNGIGDYPLAY